MIVPEMIVVPGSSSRIMRREVSLGLFNQVMKGYKPATGPYQERLKTLLAVTLNARSFSIPMTYVSLSDAREFAYRLGQQTGRHFGVPADEEWVAARNQLVGGNRTWVYTNEEDGHETYSLLSGVTGNSSSLINVSPDHRDDMSAIRLVEYFIPASNFN